MVIEIVIAGLIFLAGALILGGFFTVEQQNKAVVERFGRFVRIAEPGLNFKIPFIEIVRGTINLRVRQLDVTVETKTEDNVFVTMMVSVQYRILQTKTYEAFYMLDNPEQQITSFVFDVVRARVPKIKLDDLFEKKDDIANAVEEELQGLMSGFGFEIVKALVTDIDPDSRVKAAMNEINEAQRLRVAALERGEAEKILKVKQAEAESESKALQGKGIAQQRHAIVEGLRDSVDQFQRSIPGSNPSDVMILILMTQYFDTLKEIGASAKSNTILLSHSPNSIKDVADQLREAIIVGQEVSKS